MMRDFYWRRDGLRWVVATVEQDGDAWINETILFTTWLERTAAKVCGVIFETYLQGQDVQRSRASQHALQQRGAVE